MTPVGGSRHYVGGGLGHEGIWGCPSCGEENSGPISQGCTACGAGKPGQKVSEPPPPPDPTPQPEGEEQLGVFDRWALAHPQATLEQAYTAGYIEGVRAARKAQLAAHPPPQEEPVFHSTGKEARTIAAALELFRDQVLTKDHEAVESGEWCSPDEVTALIHQLQHEATYA